MYIHTCTCTQLIIVFAHIHIKAQYCQASYICAYITVLHELSRKTEIEFQCICVYVYIYIYMCICVYVYIYSQYTMINWDDVKWPSPIMVCYWAQPLSVWSVSHPFCRTTVPHPGNATYPNWLLTGHWNALEFGWMVMTFIEIWWTYIYIYNVYKS